MYPRWKLVATTVLLLLLAIAVPTARAEDSSSCAGCEDCVRRMLADLENRGWLGMALHLHGGDVQDGLEIQFLDAEGPAADIGLRDGDRVLVAQGVDLTRSSPEEIQKLFHGIAPGDRVVLEVTRSGERQKVTLRARPMTLRARAEAIGAFFLRSLATEGGRRHSEGEHHSPGRLR